MIHCEIVRQSARVVAMDRERLRCVQSPASCWHEGRSTACGAGFTPAALLQRVRARLLRPGMGRRYGCMLTATNHPAAILMPHRSGDRACVRFRFLQRPEYLTAGTRFVFRWGSCSVPAHCHGCMPRLRACRSHTSL